MKKLIKPKTWTQEEYKNTLRALEENNQPKPQSSLDRHKLGSFPIRESVPRKKTLDELDLGDHDEYA